MARVIKAPEEAKNKEVARYTHDCGALVEFERSDVQGDRDGLYVICPSCRAVPWISVSVLQWTTLSEQKRMIDRPPVGSKIRFT